MTPLILAASAGRTQTVKILLNAGAEVNAVNDGGHSALQYSASKGWKEVMLYYFVLTKKLESNCF